MTTKPLILKKYNHEQQNNIEVDGHYVQLLKPFQIQGIRFLFRNYINGLGAILNDESGFGKTVQTVIFLSAIRAVSKLIHNVLILSTEENINHWQFHFHKWSNENISNNNKDYQHTDFTISTLDKCSNFFVQEWDVVVVDDLEIHATIKNLRGIKCKKKIWLTKHNLRFDLKKMFVLMNWISNETIGKRNIFLRNFRPCDDDDILTRWKKRQLLENFSNRWVLRRVRDNIEADFPLVDEQIYIQDLNNWRQGSTDQTKLPEVAHNADTVCIDDNLQDNGSPTNDNLSRSSIELIDLNNTESDFPSPSMLDFTLYCNRSFENSDDFMKRKGVKDISGLKIKKTKPEIVYAKIDESVSSALDPISSDSESGDIGQNIVENQSENDIMDIEMNATEPVSKHRFLDIILDSFKSGHEKKAVTTNFKKQASIVSSVDNLNDVLKKSKSDILVERKKQTEDVKINVLGSDTGCKPHFLDVLFENQRCYTRISKQAAISLPSPTHCDAQLKQTNKYIKDNKPLSDCRSHAENSHIKPHFKILDNILFASRQ